MKLSEIARALDASVAGDGDIDIARPAQPEDARRDGDLALVFSAEALDKARAAGATAALVPAGLALPEGQFRAAIVVARPRAALPALTRLFAARQTQPAGIDPKALVDPAAEIGAGASIGPFVTIGARAVIGDGAVVLSHVSIGAGARIGAETLIHPGARIGAGIEIGQRVVIHPNASIGADGFSFVTPNPPPTRRAARDGRVDSFLTSIERVHSLGTVILGDDVEVGACSTVDRATIGATRIGAGTKIDNLVMVGHNCVVGESCLIVSQTGLSGSVTVGDRVVMGGQVGIADHLTIGSDCILAARAGLLHDVPPNTLVMGYPAAPAHEFYARLKHTSVQRLRRLGVRVADLVARVDRLDGGRGDG